MAITALALLSLYALIALAVLLAPVKNRDPQMGVAVGCLLVILIGLAGVGGLLALGYFFEQRWLVRGVFWATLSPIIILAGNAVAYPFMRARERRAAAQHEAELAAARSPTEAPSDVVEPADPTQR
jgi:small-conductance mechanosensitive channel